VLVDIDLLAERNVRADNDPVPGCDPPESFFDRENIGLRAYVIGCGPRLPPSGGGGVSVVKALMTKKMIVPSVTTPKAVRRMMVSRRRVRSPSSRSERRWRARSDVGGVLRWAA